MKHFAVVTGDIVNFTRLSAEKRQHLITETEKLLKSWVDKPEDAEVFRGDSYQFLMADVGEAIRKSVQLVCWFKKHSEASIDLGSRISLGIGEIAYKGKSVLDSDGEAFHHSGRHFDKMSREEILAVTTTNPEINEQLEIILSFINLFINQWNVKQAEAIYLACEGYTQTNMAEVLNINQGAVNNRLKVARWKEVEKGLNYVIHLVTK